MARKKKNSWIKQKGMIVFITFMFVVSTIGVIFLQSPSQNGDIDFPEEQILDNELTPELEAMLVQNSRVIVQAQAQEDSTIFDDLEILMPSFQKVAVEDGSAYFVYLVKEISDTEKIKITAIGNKTELDTYDEEEIVAFICDNSHPYVASKYMICAIRGM
ncbi:MAG: hypothetical protein U9P44_00965 [archaeon]|nr:hypothetical protein [archaeon]